MKTWTLCAAIIGVLFAACDSCESCRSDSEAVDDSRHAQSASSETDSEAGAGGGVVDASTDGAPARDEETGPQRPAQSPMTVAQRFVVGWASGSVEPLAEISDGDAADMVRRAMAGDTVETPLGSISPGGQRPLSFAFSNRRATQPDQESHRIEFTLIVTMPEGTPGSSRHVVFVRRTDNKVISWNAPSPLSDGGV